MKKIVPFLLLVFTLSCSKDCDCGREYLRVEIVDNVTADRFMGIKCEDDSFTEIRISDNLYSLLRSGNFWGFGDSCIDELKKLEKFDDAYSKLL